MLDKIIAHFPDESFLKADGFDEAIIGFDSKSMRLIYSIEKCIDILCRDMEDEDAAEHFWYNVEGSYVVEKTPIWCHDIF
jgi:hypothetical protein